MWDETIRIMNDLYDNVWADRSEIVVDHCVDITLPVRFLWLSLHYFPTISPSDFALCHRCRRWFMPPSNHYILVTADTRVRASGDMDKRPRYSS